jgi:tyrosinase
LSLAFILMSGRRADAGPRVRKNYKSLTALEETRFVDACLRLKAIDPGATNGSLLGWDDFVKDHGTYSSSAHASSTQKRGAAFLAWHREFLLRLEDALRATHVDNANVTIPYWDWTESLAGNDADSDGFPDDLATLIGGNGDSTDNYIVKTGPFAHSTGDWTLTVNPLSGSTSISGPELKRRFGYYASRLPTTAQVNAVLALTIFDLDPWNRTSTSSSFRNRLEGWVGSGAIHNQVHVWIGGNMYPVSAAPNDPVFFMHHANVDRLFCKWQEATPFEFHHLPSGGGTCLPYGAPAALGHNACDVMQPFSPKRPVDLLNVAGLGYEYDDCAGPCEYGPGVGNPDWEGKTLSQVMILYAL